MLPVPCPGCHITERVLSLPRAWCCFCCCYSTSGQMSPAAQTDGNLHLSPWQCEPWLWYLKGFSHAGISFHCIIFCLYEFPHKTKQIPKRPLSVPQDQREMSPPLPAPHGFSANLSHPWDAEDLCFPSVLFSAWWILVSLVPSGLSISYLRCFSHRASVAAILG